MTTPIHTLTRAGQSIWLDYIRRDVLHNGELEKMIRERGLRGMTSNPSIFEKAIASSDYDDVVAAAAQRQRDTKSVYETVAIGDIQAAADLLRPVYDESSAHDGYVSLEVSPELAHDTA